MAVRSPVAAVTKVGKIDSYSGHASDNDFITNIDTRDYKRVLIACQLSGNVALSATNAMGLSVQHSDDTTAANYSDVPASALRMADGSEGFGAGELWRYTANPGTAGVDLVGEYLGEKRYVRIGPKETGSVSSNVTYDLAVLLQEARNEPVS